MRVSDSIISMSVNPFGLSGDFVIYFLPQKQYTKNAQKYRPRPIPVGNCQNLRGAM